LANSQFAAGWFLRSLSFLFLVSSSRAYTSHLTTCMPCFIISRSELRKVLFFWRRQCVFFVCAWNISGIAERICTKSTWKTCMVPRSDEFEGQGQRSRSPGTKTAFLALSAACVLRTRFVFGRTSSAYSFVVNSVVNSVTSFCLENWKASRPMFCTKFVR